MGKTSTLSRLNVPGKVGWMIMELPGPLLLGYTMLTLPAELGSKSLPWENWVLAGIFVSHLFARHTQYLHFNISLPCCMTVPVGLQEPR